MIEPKSTPWRLLASLQTLLWAVLLLCAGMASANRAVEPLNLHQADGLVQGISAEDGCFFLRARWMDPNTGRFLSEDPWDGRMEIPSSQHRFIYAGSSPVQMIDPSGREFNMSTVMSAITNLGNLATRVWIKIRVSTALMLPVGRAAVTRVQEVQSLTQSTGPRVTVYTGLARFPDAGRRLFVAVGDNAEEYAIAVRRLSEGYGTIYKAEIPEKMLNAMYYYNMALRPTLSEYGGVVSREIMIYGEYVNMIRPLFTFHKVVGG